MVSAGSLAVSLPDPRRRRVLLALVHQSKPGHNRMGGKDGPGGSDSVGADPDMMSDEGTKLLHSCVDHTPIHNDIDLLVGSLIEVI